MSAASVDLRSEGKIEENFSLWNRRLRSCNEVEGGGGKDMANREFP